MERAKTACAIVLSIRFLRRGPLLLEHPINICVPRNNDLRRRLPFVGMNLQLDLPATGISYRADHWLRSLRWYEFVFRPGECESNHRG